MDSLRLADQLAQHGQTFVSAAAWTEGESVLQECLAIGEKLEPDDWRTFRTKSLLGACLLGQKKYAEAEPLLLAGYEGMMKREKTIPPQGKVRIQEAIERLVQLYDALEKKDEAVKWRKELEASKAARKSPETEP
jgi:hypothetical protein